MFATLQLILTVNELAYYRKKLQCGETRHSEYKVVIQRSVLVINS